MCVCVAVFCGVSLATFTNLWVFSRSEMEPLTLSSRGCLCNSLQKWLRVSPCCSTAATTAMSRHEPLTHVLHLLTGLIRSASGAAGGAVSCVLCTEAGRAPRAHRGACQGCQRAPAPHSREAELPLGSRGAWQARKWAHKAF